MNRRGCYAWWYWRHRERHPQIELGSVWERAIILFCWFTSCSLHPPSWVRKDPFSILLFSSLYLSLSLLSITSSQDRRGGDLNKTSSPALFFPRKKNLWLKWRKSVKVFPAMSRRLAFWCIEQKNLRRKKGKRGALSCTPPSCSRPRAPDSRHENQNIMSRQSIACV